MRRKRSTEPSRRVARPTSDLTTRINASLSAAEPREVAAAIGDLLRASGVSTVARDARVRREGLYKTFSSSGNPQLSTLLSVLTSVGLGLKVYRLNPAQRHQARLGPSRFHQLKADLEMSAEERVRAASLTAAAVPRGKRASRTVRGFEEFEDFLAWKERSRIRG